MKAKDTERDWDSGKLEKGDFFSEKKLLMLPTKMQQHQQYYIFNLVVQRHQAVQLAVYIIQQCIQDGGISLGIVFPYFIMQRDEHL